MSHLLDCGIFALGIVAGVLLFPAWFGWYLCQIQKERDFSRRVRLSSKLDIDVVKEGREVAILFRETQSK